MAQIIEVTKRYNLADHYNVVDANRHNIFRHSYLHEYLRLQYVCLTILHGAELQLNTGTDQSLAYSLVDTLMGQVHDLVDAR